MTPAQAAKGFAAVGSEPRLKVLRALVRAGDAGLTVTELQSRLDMPLSTLVHHLRLLEAAQVIVQTRTGRSVMNRANYETIEALAGYLLEECCADGGTDGGTTP